MKFIAYTSILHADRSPLILASEHRQTEAALAESGVPTATLRNGWYTENYLNEMRLVHRGLPRAVGTRELFRLQPALLDAAIVGSTGEGRISLAACADYALAAAKVLTSNDQGGRTYELAGDNAWTLAEFAAELSRQVGQTVVYRNLPEADFAGVLVGAGWATDLAKVLADADSRAAVAALFDETRDLSLLIGRPTIQISETIAAALQAARSLD